MIGNSKKLTLLSLNGKDFKKAESISTNDWISKKFVIIIGKDFKDDKSISLNGEGFTFILLHQRVVLTV